LTQANETMDRIVAEAMTALFEGCGVTIQEIQAKSPQPTGAAIAGLVGFTSDAMRGTLMIASTFDLFARSRPAELRGQALSEYVARDWLYLRDWAAELANMLVGRVKNQFVSYGVTLRIATPTALSGSALAVATPSSKRTKPRVFRADRDEIWVWWDVLVDDAFVLERTDGEAAAAEGDVLLF
jgi:CheY-specific phosphatase CheX